MSKYTTFGSHTMGGTRYDIDLDDVQIISSRKLAHDDNYEVNLRLFGGAQIQLCLDAEELSELGVKACQD